MPRGPLFRLRVEGDRAERGGAGDLLGVARRADAVVEHRPQDGQADAEGEADERVEREVQGNVRAGGLESWLRVADAGETDGTAALFDLGLDLGNNLRQARGDRVGEVGRCHRGGVGSGDRDDRRVECRRRSDLGLEGFGCDAEVAPLQPTLRSG